MSGQTTLECNVRNPILAKRDVRQAYPRHRPRLDCAHVYYGYARPGTGPVFSSNTAVLHQRHDAARLRSQGCRRDARGRGISEEPDGKRFTSTWWAVAGRPISPKVGTYVKQALEDVGISV